MLNKPSVLFLLLLIMSIVFIIVFDIIFTFIKLEPSIFTMPIEYGIAAFYVGRIYANKYKIRLSQKHKIKTILYFSLVQLTLLLSFLIFMLDIKTLDSLKLFASSALTIIVITVISAFCMYFSLGFGCVFGINKYPCKKCEK